jgi:phage head maturation protease
LHEIELWEVSLVTFPMLAEARVGQKGEAPADDAMHDLAAAIEAVRREMGAD